MIYLLHFRLDLKICSFAVTWPTQRWRCRLKIFYWTSQSKIFLSWKTLPKVTDYFNVEFSFSNAYLNSAKYIYCFIQQNIKRTDAWCQILKRFIFTLRILSYESRNKLKPVWDFILAENLTSVFSQLFTCAHMNWGKMKLKLVWISCSSFWPKWNFRPAWNLHVNRIYPKWNE